MPALARAEHESPGRRLARLPPGRGILAGIGQVDGVAAGGSCPDIVDEDAGRPTLHHGAFVCFAQRSPAEHQFPLYFYPPIVLRPTSAHINHRELAAHGLRTLDDVHG